jgi:flagellar assembly protein FliH
MSEICVLTDIAARRAPFRRLFVAQLSGSEAFAPYAGAADHPLADGYHQAAGLDDGHNAECSDYDRGFADGQAAIEAELATQRTEYSRLIATASALQAQPSEELAALIGETIAALTERICRQTPVIAAEIEMIVEEACGWIGEADSARRLVLHPRDAQLLDTKEFALTIATDTSMPRGTIRIDHSAGWIEHGRACQLDALRAALTHEGHSA